MKDIETLRNKYNLSYTTGHSGNYNNNNGSNCNSPLLSDSRKLKSYLTKVLKEECGALAAFNIHVSLKDYYDNIIITFEAPKAQLFEAYELLSMEGLRLINNFVYTDLSTNARKAIYNKIIKNKYEVQYSEFLKPEYKEMYNFIDELLQSFTYNHSDVYTDYFDAGISYKILFQASDREETDTNYYNLSNEEIIEKLGVDSNELTEEEKIRLARKEEETKIRLAMIEENNKAIAKRNEETKQKIKDIENDILISYAPKPSPVYRKAMFSNFNKLSTLSEVKEYLHDEAVGVECKDGTLCHILKMVTFKHQKQFKDFCNLLMSDYTFLSAVGGCGFKNEETKEDLEYCKVYSMNTKQREAAHVVWSRDCILINCLENKEEFVVDSEGFNYARYVGILSD